MTNNTATNDARAELDDLTRQFKGYPPARLADEVWAWAARHSMLPDTSAPVRETTIVFRDQPVDVFAGLNGEYTIFEKGDDGLPIATFTFHGDTADETAIQVAALAALAD